ncbi:MAG: hypothetical protein NVS3B16_04720 [Vulcanimicrobiaceae bacterium]
MKLYVEDDDDDDDEFDVELLALDLLLSVFDESVVSVPIVTLRLAPWTVTSPEWSMF